MRNFKIRITSPSDFKKIQEILIADGCYWIFSGSEIIPSDKYSNYYSILVDTGGMMTNEGQDSFEELCVDEYVLTSETVFKIEKKHKKIVVIDGKNYYLDDVVEAIKFIKTAND